MKTKMKNAVRMLALLAATGVLASSCSDSDDAPKDNTRKEITLSRAEQELAVQSTDFAFRLLQTADAEWEAEQVVLSPLSASFALSMVANGAAGNTQEEILNTLGFVGFSATEMNVYNQKLVKELVKMDRTATIGIANSMWMGKSFEPYDTYRETLEDYYDAEVKSVDFASDKTLKQINKWCSDKTHGCIPEFLKELNASTRLMLINALYFKGEWADSFDKDLTKDGDFHAATGRQKVSYMRRTADYRYTANDRFAVAEFPYGNEAFSFTVVLPNEGVGVSECLSALDADEWASVQSEMTKRELNVRLPKFELEGENDLIPLLKKLGIQDAFAGAADFSNLSKDPLFISMVKQATYFRVDEEGAEAAAVTNVGFDLLAPGPGYEPTVINFHVDRPFLFFLTEKSTGTILFMGKIEKI